MKFSKIRVRVRQFFHSILAELLEDHRVDIYLIEKGDIISKKKSIPYIIPPVGAVIEIDETEGLFEVDKVYISNAFSFIHLYGRKIPFTSYIRYENQSD